MSGKRPYRIRVVGVGGVGKSALTVRFIRGDFDHHQAYIPTIEDSYTKDVQIDELGQCSLDILDTAGQEEYAALRDTYMKGGEGFILVFSITEKSSLDDLTEFYQQILMVKDDEQVPMVLVGNKCDLADEREIEYAEGLKRANDWRIQFFEGSAKDNTNVDEAFYEVVREIQRHRERTGDLGPTDLSYGSDEEGDEYDKKPPKGKGNCCILM